MRPTALQSARRLVLSALVLGGALAAAPGTAAAQLSVSARYSQPCGPGGCGPLRFDIVNTGAATLLFDSFLFTSTQPSVLFAAEEGGVATTYTAVDVFGELAPLSGFTVVGSGGQTVFVNFLDPLGPGFQFQLDAGTAGYVDVPVIGAPAFGPATFQFRANAGNVTIAGPVSVVPEPATIVLMVSGLAAIAGGTAFKRRRAA